MTENLLSEKQQEVYQLRKEIEDLKKMTVQDKFSFNTKKGIFQIDEYLSKTLEFDEKEITIGDKIAQGNNFVRIYPKVDLVLYTMGS